MYSYYSSPASSIGSAYSATSAMSIDIKPSRSAGTTAASCAYPSWPRRTSLHGVTEEATSYISDDDLFPSVFEDDTSAEPSPMATPYQTASPTVMHNGEPISSSVLRHLLQQQRLQQQRCVLPPPKNKKRRASRKSGVTSPNKQMSVIAEEGMKK